MKPSPSTIAQTFTKHFNLSLLPDGLLFAKDKPEGAKAFKEGSGGCVMPLIFSCSRGNVLALDKDTAGWPCATFYLGFSDWIFNGIEKFLSNENVWGRECERFIKSPALAKRYIESLVLEKQNAGFAVFKPLIEFNDDEEPEIVMFFANPDQISGLVMLSYFNAPEAEDRVVTRFASACGSTVTFPLYYSRKQERKAVWGLHDISVRSKLPRDVMSLTFPYFFLRELYAEIPESFLPGDKWEGLVKKKK